MLNIDKIQTIKLAQYRDGSGQMIDEGPIGSSSVHWPRAITIY